ncbi:MAG: cysteine--tRNA ligase [Nitrososphaerota archaeon]|nr:cysteine--tRNA ligase [Nitrososphaerota archaeon]MDG6978018.1 cysteine--tRNA ligase [Nitrososphaerota archaeon]
MALVLYNSLGRKLTRFKPISGRRVKMYTCGPTVYNYAHIGNFRTFVFEDVLRRELEHKGYAVTQVKNITDVEDRIIEGIKRTGKSLKELTDYYTDAFMEDLDSLNIERAEHYPRATDSIGDIVAAVEKLLKKGYAYRSDDGSVYFSIGRFPRYGRLSGIKQADVKSGTRVAVDHYEKLGANDFALWKAWNPDDGEVFWETSLGKGRPGWHIECSVMAMKLLGSSFDIHTGGKDLRFPHHENEIAQSEALSGRPFVRVWLHAEFLNIGGEKMSKSLGNMVTLRDLLEEGWSPRAIRLFLLSGHYRDELNLADGSMAQAEATVRKIDQLYERLRLGEGSAPRGRASLATAAARSMLRSFERAMDDDLNTPEALASFFEFQRKVNRMVDSGRLTKGDYRVVSESLEEVDSVLGVLEPWAAEPRSSGPEGAPSAEVEALVQERELARKAKDYARADAIRDELKRRGVDVQDTAGGPVWRRLSTSP